MSGHRLTGFRAASTLADLGFAGVAAGVIARRRRVLGLLERVQADARVVRRLRRLRREFGSGPVELVVPGRRMVVVVDPADVGRVLDGSPSPFHPANLEKRAALRQFQPHGVLVSSGHLRDERRAVNEAALETGRPLHHLAEPFTEVIREEAARLRETAVREGKLDAEQFTIGWWRLVRRLVLGTAARDDDEITDRLWQLRSAANWSFLAPQRRRLRRKFTDELHRYAESAEPDSLLGALAATPASGASDPIGQVPHWLFAFDAAGMALTRTLALLATHPEQRAAATAEAVDRAGSAALPYLRGCVLESVRLWPTTPMILRDTTEDTIWRDGDEQFTIDGGAALLIAAVAFHRDEQLLPFAHDFVPEIWLDGRAQQYPQLVPFSAGPAACPGRDLVLFITSTLLAEMLRSMTFELRSTPTLDPAAPLPLTYNNFGVEFAVTPVHEASEAG
ncbi:cytochrome P450 [Nocardia suismassiliense]|uniref:cytochrome P450 n=1 Tax=Nocardia suismassiliense TaxID=2077092 RepID=UPI000D1E70CD|nr:cytochrome P450 [Nocardia suismassiliense]